MKEFNLDIMRHPEKWDTLVEICNDDEREESVCDEIDTEFEEFQKVK